MFLTNFFKKLQENLSSNRLYKNHINVTEKMKIQITFWASNVHEIQKYLPVTIKRADERH